MFKLPLIFAVSFASAATISTSATCDGVTTVGTFSASCADGRSGANAVVQIDHPFDLGVLADTVPNLAASSSASAGFLARPAFFAGLAFLAGLRAGLFGAATGSAPFAESFVFVLIYFSLPHVAVVTLITPVRRKSKQNLW
jgi:hypothetical protein